MPDKNWLTAGPIAHRGLHDRSSGRPENSIAAARAAIAGGYAIECDVRLAADGVPVVFHDRETMRLLGRPGELARLTSIELAQSNLQESNETVPTLRSLLDWVDGRVGIVIEMKSDGDSRQDEALVRALADCLVARPDDRLAVMSFSQDQLRLARQSVRGRPIGLVAEGRDEQSLETHRKALEIPVDFVSYALFDLDNGFCREVTRRGLPLLTWTVRSEEQAAVAREHSAQITFEGYRP